MTSTGFADAGRLLRHDLRRAGGAALLVPPGVLALGALLVGLASRSSEGNRETVVAVVLEALVPLGAGVAAGSVLAAEQAVELQVSVPARVATTVLRRVLLVLGWTAAWAAVAAAGVYAAGWWRPEGGLAAAELAWLAPAMALAGIAVAASVLSSGAGLPTALVAGVWFGQQMRAAWFAGHRWAQPLYLFPHTRDVIAPDRLAVNRVVLLAIGVAGIAAGWLLLHAEERLVTGTSGPAGRRWAVWRLRAAPADRPDGPGAGRLRRWAVLLGTARYELRMQLGKRSVWIASGLVGAVFLWEVLNLRRSASDPVGTTAQNVAGYALSLNLFAGAVFGCLLADRLVRDRRLGVVEVLDATPAGFGTRLAGKYLGTIAACLVPLLLIWVIGLARLATQMPAGATFGSGMAAFAVIELPGLLFIAALALAGPTLLGGPLFRVLFVGYWLWNILPAEVAPGPSGTLLTPSGDVARVGLFGIGGTFTALNRQVASRGDAVASIGLVLAIAVVVLAALAVRETRLRANR
jgi:ABC-2 type transport system permease protein